MEEKVLAVQELAGALRDLLADLVNLVQLAKLPDAADDHFDDGDEAGQNIDQRELLDEFAKLVWVIRQQNHDARLLLIKLTVELFHGNVVLHEREFASYCDYVAGLVETVSQHASCFCPIRIEDLNIEEWPTDFANWAKQVRESSNELARSPKRYADWLYRCCEQELRAAEHKLRYPAIPFKLDFSSYVPTEDAELLNGRSSVEAVKDSSTASLREACATPGSTLRNALTVKDLANQLRYRGTQIQKGSTSYGIFFSDPIASECLDAIKRLLLESDGEDRRLYELDPWRFLNERLLSPLGDNFYDWPLGQLTEFIETKLKSFATNRRENDTRPSPDSSVGEQPVPKGVSLLDAAICLCEDDRIAAKETKKRWRNSREPKLPTPIGLDASHSQTHLFQLEAIANFIEQCESVAAASECRAKLRQKLRPIRAAES